MSQATACSKHPSHHNDSQPLERACSFLQQQQLGQPAPGIGLLLTCHAMCYHVYAGMLEQEQVPTTTMHMTDERGLPE